jgi:3-phosphoglycerate kinase
MNISFEQIHNSRVLLRADLNEPIWDGRGLRSTKRIDASITTIHELLARKNKVIVLSHHSAESQSLAPIASYLQKTFRDLQFIQSTDIDTAAELVKTNSDAELTLLENTRLFGNGADEKNDDAFAKQLASLGEYFVFDAFSVAHREHASVVGVSKYLPHCLGPVAGRELTELSKVLDKNNPPFVILGGAKLSTKLPLLETFVKNGSKIFLGGAMAHPIMAARGVDIKSSKTENIDVLDMAQNKDILVPGDYIWNDRDMIVDAGENTILTLENEIKNAKNILWNGPLGLYEDGFTSGTYGLIHALDGKTDKNIVLGGGDTLTVLEHFPYFTCSYISLSGGAMLEFLAKGSLPGILANQ